MAARFASRYLDFIWSYNHAKMMVGSGIVGSNYAVYYNPPEHPVKIVFPALVGAAGGVMVGSLAPIIAPFAVAAVPAYILRSFKPQ